MLIYLRKLRKTQNITVKLYNFRSQRNTCAYKTRDRWLALMRPVGWAPLQVPRRVTAVQKTTQQRGIWRERELHIPVCDWVVADDEMESDRVSSTVWVESELPVVAVVDTSLMLWWESHRGFRSSSGCWWLIERYADRCGSGALQTAAGAVRGWLTWW